MTEERVLALAGLFQATTLAQQLANEGRCNEPAYATSIASVFRIDAPSVVAVFGKVSDVRLGLRTLIQQLDEGQRDIAITRMAVTVLRLERSLSRRRDLRDKLQQAITSTQRQVEHFGHDSSQVAQRLSEIYTSTLSTLKPRVLVHGKPDQLQQAAVVAQVRTCLLAAIRAAVLWRQLGGRQWQIILYRRQCGMLARGLLTGATLETG